MTKLSHVRLVTSFREKPDSFRRRLWRCVWRKSHPMGSRGQVHVGIPRDLLTSSARQLEREPWIL